MDVQDRPTAVATATQVLVDGGCARPVLVTTTRFSAGFPKEMLMTADRTTS
jgi:hypothetical protein